MIAGRRIIRSNNTKTSLFLLVILSGIYSSYCSPYDNEKIAEERNAAVAGMGMGMGMGISSSSQNSALRRKPSSRQVQDENGACPLCEGINLLADKVPSTRDSGIPDTSPLHNATCAEIDFSYQQQTCSFDLPSLYRYFFKHCCEASLPTYQCEKNVHDLILDDDIYDAAVPPIIRQDVPLDIGVNFVYVFLESIEAEKGTASVVFRMTYMWNDPRLKWDIIDFGTCTNFITVWTGHEVEKTSIWIPSLDLLNKIEGVQTFPDTKATVDSKGNVMLTVEGSLKAFCSFKGLANIPFDILGCQFLFGPTETSHDHNYYFIDEETLLFSSFGLKAEYNEWRPVPELATQGMISKIGVLYLNLYFQRAKNHYVSNIIIPTTILTYLSFFTFLLDMRVGERLGFGMALTLVVVAQQIVTSDLIVISNVRLWIDKFVGWSFYWVLFTMVQSVVIGYLYFLREDRQAKTVNKRLSIMSLDDRAAMMTNAAHRADEEALPLTEHVEEEVKHDTAVKDESVAQGAGENSWTSWFFEISLRKVDYICLAFAFVTYTAFVAIMFITVKNTDVWLSQDPTWYSNNTNLDTLVLSFTNGDPNTR